MACSSMARWAESGRCWRPVNPCPLRSPHDQRPVPGASGTEFSIAGTGSRSAEQQRFDVPCALQDVIDLDLLRLQAVKNQIIAMDAAANPVALVARHQWVGHVGIGQGQAAIQ